VEPDPDLILRSDPAGRSIWWAIRYVLRVRTNLVIIVASALGYFYFAGLRSFAIIYATGHYTLSKPVADSLVLVIGAGAVAGVFASGRLADRLLRGGMINARVLIPAICLLAIGPVLAPAMAATSLAVALPLLTAGPSCWVPRTVDGRGPAGHHASHAVGPGRGASDRAAHAR
jgi:sugar phosphate permease